MTQQQDVSVCLITKDEPYLEQALRAIRPHVRQICAVWTGGNPLTPAERALIDSYVEDPAIDAEIDSFSFGLARNKSFSLAQCRHVMWMDADDEIVGLEHLKSELEFFETQAHQTIVIDGKTARSAQLMFPYEYLYDHLGNVISLLSRERLMLNNGIWQWNDEAPFDRCPAAIHESIMPVGHRHARSAMVWKHHKNPKKIEMSEMLDGVVVQPTAARNLRILRKVVGKRPTPRNLYYHAVSSKECGQWEEALNAFRRVLPMLGDSEELFEVYRSLSQIHRDRREWDQAIVWAWKAVETRENRLESWFDLARCYYLRAEAGGGQRDWERCVKFGEQALLQPPTVSLHPTTPMVARHEIYKWMAIAYNALGWGQRALLAAEAGLQAVPDDPHLKFNARLFKAAVTGNALRDAARSLLEIKGPEPAVDIVIKQAFEDVLGMLGPHGLVGVEQAPAAAEAKIEAPAPTRRMLREISQKLDIVFACGDGWEPWDPETLDKQGIGGGSEVAVVEMARRLARRGHRVGVFNPCAREGMHDGVQYIRWEQMQAGGMQCDVLIGWRATAWREKFDAHLSLLWLHDTVAWGAPGRPATKEEIEAWDFVLAVSRWHKHEIARFHGLDQTRILKTRNGVARPERFRPAAAIARDPHKVVWTSCLTRGCQTLLDMWLSIRAKVPDATLEIFYGTETWKKMGHSADALARLEASLESLKSAGVRYRGRVPPSDLAAAVLGAGVWLYPNYVFPEVSCVAAMEAQMAGLRVVSADCAALPETVKWGRLIGHQPSAVDFSFQDAAIEAMTEPWAPGEREEQIALATVAFSLDTLTDDWIAVFKEKLAGKIEKATNGFHTTVSFPIALVAPSVPDLPPYQGVL